MRRFKEIFAKLPFFIIDLWFMLLNISSTEKNGETKNSVSTEFYYTAMVHSFVSNNFHFKYFRRSYFYRIVLEHVGVELAKKYFEEITKYLNGDRFEDYVDVIKKFDRVGNPFLVNINGFKVSGSSLRYIKVFLEIKSIFGDDRISNICEIGGGYGGQAFMFDSFSSQPIQYKIFDLPCVCKLSAKFLNHFYLKGCFDTQDINNFDGQREFDLVISNYAFSELPRSLQEIYLRKCIMQAKRGYLTMNTGYVDTGLDTEEVNIARMSSAELLKMIPGSRIISESPITGNNNYIVVWGDQ